MKKSLRYTAIILALCLLVMSFAACSPTEGTHASTPTPDPAASFNENTLIVTVEGSPVYWPEFQYWLNYSLQYYGFTPGSEIDWDADYSSNMTLREFVMYDAVNAVALYRVIDNLAESLGTTLTAEDKANIETIMSENAAYFESDEAYEAYLTENYLSEELMEYLLTASCNYYNIFVKMFGADGEQVPDADAIAFGTDNGYYRAKHILMSFTDDEGNPYSEDEMADKLSQLEDILSQIKASDDPVEAFDQFMLEYNEDPGMAAYPNGYQFVKGDMVTEFQAAVESLEDYGISDIVTMGDYGYTIIMRLPLDPDEAAISDMYGSTLRYNTANFEYEALANTWTVEANIEYSDNYSYVDPADWF